MTDAMLKLHAARRGCRDLAQKEALQGSSAKTVDQDGINTFQVPERTFLFQEVLHLTVSAPFSSQYRER